MLRLQKRIASRHQSTHPPNHPSIQNTHPPIRSLTHKTNTYQSSFHTSGLPSLPPSITIILRKVQNFLLVVLLPGDDPDDLAVRGGQGDGLGLHHLLHNWLRDCKKKNKEHFVCEFDHFANRHKRALNRLRLSLTSLLTG